ncbi:hypothetical protein STENM223S_10828 [Streptomyces tendae]
MPEPDSESGPSSPAVRGSRPDPAGRRSSSAPSAGRPSPSPPTPGPAAPSAAPPEASREPSGSRGSSGRRVPRVLGVAHDDASMASRSAAMPREPYALTEPSEMPSVSATWASVMSAK